MALTAAARVTAIKEAIDAKLAGGAVKAVNLPDGRSLQHMTLDELQKALEFWEGRALEESDADTSPRVIRFQSVRLGGTP